MASKINTPTKVIFDTNIWITYTINAQTSLLIDFIVDNEITLFTCSSLINEFEEVLSRKKFKKYVTPPISKYVSVHKKIASFVDIEYSFVGSPDPKDDFLFDLAEHTEATHLVTGDKKLWDFSYKRLQIISHTDFKKLFI